MLAPDDRTSPLAPSEAPSLDLSRAADEVANISVASRRLRALARLSGSLTDALSPEDAAMVVERRALAVLGARGAIVMTLGVFPPVVATAPPTADRVEPARLRMVHAIGLPAAMTETLRQLPLDAPMPMAEVAREGASIFLPSTDALRGYPEWGEAMIDAGARAAAIVPVWANGELRGVLALTWNAARTFDVDECAFVETLGVMCAQAIMRAHLRAAEQQARTEAERANASKAQLLATISHELRTPMNAVLGYTQLLTDEVSGPVSELQRDHLGRMRASGTHMLALIEDLLGYARIEAGADVVRLDTVLVADIVEQSLHLVSSVLAQKGLRIRVDVPTTPIPLRTDGRKVRQILVNLLANATKFTESGEIVLAVRGEAPAVAVSFQVTDPGTGIALTDHERVFDAFWRHDPTSDHPAGSTGLGLAVARKLARLLGGDVSILRSAPGRGSTFDLTLPMQTPESDTAA